jgi:1-deoxy-D-xylulose-5-phosphate reductoisomerase
MSNGNPRRVAILGSTGSIGQSALAVADVHPARVEIVGLAAGGNVKAFAGQVARYRPRVVSMGSAPALAEALADMSEPRPETHVGADGLIAVATHPDVDLVLVASSGTAALDAVLAAIEAGKTIALANKEVLVMAGSIVTAAARRRGVSILPVDSEHNAIHQCLHGRRADEVRRIVLTASGGPFRGHSLSELEQVGPDAALRHPTWRMGPKITVDSATLMNKGLEVIEAHWLFGLPADRIDVVVHPQSVVHSLVELRDGSVIAQLGVTDMRLPIQYAFSYPDRWEAPVTPLDLAACSRLEFAPPDYDRFPCLRLAYRALEAGGSLPVVLNAANEVAVESFLNGRIGFTGIAQVIERALDAHVTESVETLAQIREADTRARRSSRDLVRAIELESERFV